MNLLEKYFIKIGVEREILKSMTSDPVIVNSPEEETSHESAKKYVLKENTKIRQIGKIRLLLIHTLFSLIDGEYTEQEKESFENLCVSINATDKDIQRVKEICDKIIPDANNENYSDIMTIRVLQTLCWIENCEIRLPYNKLCGFIVEDFLSDAIYKLYHREDCLKFIETLIDLAYCDSNFSEAEKNLISIIAEELSIDTDTLFKFKSNVFN